MALTQQFARVTPEYSARCRGSAHDSPGAAPHGDPPPDDLLDTDRALWGLLRYCRGTARCAPLHAALDRALSGDADGDIGFLDHDEVYDGCAEPPHPPAPAAVDAITRALLEADIDQVLAGLPDDPAAAASAVGFQGFRGDVCVYPVEHFLAPCAFFRGARLRGRCVIVWID
ncbi:DUF1877 domain-containing protein [Streptomyces mirabilis]|uniref:DUF1877 domain-containing protein n=1 Tax=Streptomyces mirabilis TaxID=68239 RepID=UPI003680D298